ncbi:acyl CoA:acetate/3-ketoacid CoA transferase [Vallitalea pronyensis]|uniref:Acyl CoA:acetate/3-ketoacid CoA transferase n=2 Tax=Vallitalea pronyensis TaxID=1348613 RepID=A0A8J8MMK2_9FIRM|nr:acyl CoA:acetate/3-ketoacid CoA transferase [Vallitalea pronyensis]
MRKVMHKTEAAQMIKNGDEVVFNGFGSMGFPEELCEAVGTRFLETGQPRDLKYFFGTGQGVWDESRMIEHMSHEGMVKRVISSHFTPMIKINRQAALNQIEAYNMPLGIISHLFRAASGRKPGIITKIGLKTCVDPRNGGGALNASSKEKLVQVMEIDGEEYLFYKAPKPTVAMLRGTTADINGNITMEKEAIYVDPFATAMAVKANGGKVIVQVERLSSEMADLRKVKIPGIIVDAIVVESEQYQSMIEKYNPAYTGEIRLLDEDACHVLEKVKALNIAAGRKRHRNMLHSIIAKRASMELKDGVVVNLGIGIPELVPEASKKMNAPDNIKLTVESGVIGGYPSNGLSFGAAVNGEVLHDEAYQFDFYDGGGLDITFVGAMQVDKIGNVNVSRTGNKIIGVGGFINLTQSSKKIVYCFPFAGGGLKGQCRDHKLEIHQEGKYQKFIEHVEEISASGEFSVEIGQEVLYITERCVFTLTSEGIMITEIAPGISLEKDIIEKMPFKPLISDNLKPMDSRCFTCE